MSTQPVAATSLAQAVINQLASSQGNIQLLNASLQFNYDTAIRNYNANALSGQAHPLGLVVPVAPKSYVLTAPDQWGFQFWEQTGPQLTPTPPLTIQAVDLGTLAPPTRSASTISVGNRINGAWFQVGAGDGTPNGFVTPPNTVSADGVTGSFTKFGAPVGAGWYLLSS